MAEPNMLTPENNPFFEKQEENKKSNWLIDMLQSIVIAIFICIVIYLFVATPNQVTGISMQPNFQNGELVLTNKLTQWFGDQAVGESLGLDYQRGDVVVLQKPGMGRDLIKRIVGMPGDEMSIQDGEVYINGNKVDEKYIPSEMRTNAGSYLQEGDEITISTKKTTTEDHYFVMGDNRPNSQDSRYVGVGQIKRSWLKGKVFLRYWPLSNLGIVNSGELENIGDTVN